MGAGGAEHASRFLLLHEPAPGPLVWVVEAGAVDDDAGGMRLADVPLADELANAHAHRKKPQLVVDHGHGADPLRDPLHVSRLGEVSGHWLFAEHVLPRFESGNHHAVMKVGR
jgi:hypothetical protein